MGVAAPPMTYDAGQSRLSTYLARRVVNDPGGLLILSVLSGVSPDYSSETAPHCVIREFCEFPFSVTPAGGVAQPFILR